MHTSCSLSVPPEPLAPTELSVPPEPLDQSVPQAPRDWSSAIEASQFTRANCAKLLLFEDDLTGQGLGYSANFYASLLLLEQRNGRVLVEVPINASWPSTPPFVNGSGPYTSPRIAYHPSGLKPATSPRWCDREPFTLQCFFEPLTHCSIPTVEQHVAPVPFFRTRYLPFHRLVRLGYANVGALRIK